MGLRRALDSPSDMDDLVVPGRNDLSGLGLRWVPRRRDVRVTDGCDEQRLGWHEFEQRVGLREVAGDRSQILVDDEWHRRRLDLVCGDDEMAEACSSQQWQR